MSSLRILRRSQHLIWMLSSSLPSLLPAMVASFSLSSCRKNRGITNLTSCGHSTAFSTTLPNWLNSTLRWSDKLCPSVVLVVLQWCAHTELNLDLVPQSVDSDPSERPADQAEEGGWESKRGSGPGNSLNCFSDRVFNSVLFTLISFFIAQPKGEIPCWVGKVPGAWEKEGGGGKRKRARGLCSDRLAWLRRGRDSWFPA